MNKSTRVFENTIWKLVKLSNALDARILLEYMIQTMNPENRISVDGDYKEAFVSDVENWTKLKVDKRKINTWIKELESADFIKKKGPKTFFVNPTNYWGGLATERSKAIRDYNSVILSL